MTGYNPAVHACPRCGNPLAALQFGPCLAAHLAARADPDHFPLPAGFGLHRHQPWPHPYAPEDYVA